MTIDDLLKLHEETCSKARSIMAAKNHDYTAGSSDPFANFRASEAMGVAAVTGILVRSIDKFQRIRSLVECGKLLVKGESVDDAIEDVINYMVLAKGIIVEERNKQPKDCEEVKQDATDWTYADEMLLEQKEKESRL